MWKCYKRNSFVLCEGYRVTLLAGHTKQWSWGIKYNHIFYKYKICLVFCLLLNKLLAQVYTHKIIWYAPAFIFGQNYQGEWGGASWCPGPSCPRGTEKRQSQESIILNIIFNSSLSIFPQTGLYGESMFCTSLQSLREALGQFLKITYRKLSLESSIL